MTMTMTMNSQQKRHLTQRITLVCLMLLIALCLLWEWKLAPLRPGGSWLIAKVVPLILMLPGVLKARLYSFQWISMAILLYFTEGIVRATSDTNSVSIALAWVEVVLTTVIFSTVLIYTKTYKRPKTDASAATESAPETIA